MKKLLVILALAATTHAAQLVWDADPWASGYNVYSNGVRVATTVNPSWTLPSVLNTSALYWVTSFDTLSESAPSNRVLVVFFWSPIP